MARDIQIETILEEQRAIYQAMKDSGVAPSSTLLFDLLETHIEVMERILDQIPTRADSAGYLSVQFHDRKTDFPWKK